MGTGIYSIVCNARGNTCVISKHLRDKKSTLSQERRETMQLEGCARTVMGSCMILLFTLGRSFQGNSW
jgi:hypothetical protein